MESMHEPVTIRCVPTSSRHTSQQRTSSTSGRRLRGGTSAGPGASWQSSSNWWQQLPTSQAPRVDEAMREHLLPRDELSMRKAFCLNNEDLTGERRTARESRGCDRDRWWLRTTGVTVDEKQRSRELDLWTSVNGVPVLCLTVLPRIRLITNVQWPTHLHTCRKTYPPHLPRDVALPPACPLLCTNRPSNMCRENKTTEQLAREAR